MRFLKSYTRTQQHQLTFAGHPLSILNYSSSPTMPAFHPWGTSSQQSRLPLTPPEYQSGYLTPMSTVSTDQGYYPSQNYQSRQIPHGQNGREFIERYGHVPAYAAQQVLTAQASHVQPRQDYHNTSSSYHYDFPAISAPILPPIRVQDQHELTTQFAHAHPEPKQKEEKATGGVAAHLDYDMDMMAAFVAEMAQSMYATFTSNLCLADIDIARSVTQSNKPSQQFRKYVSQILSSTRLPSSTIMLGLFYLASRMKLVSKRGDDTSSSGTVYRMLTTSLLLGSKFLDDNTFQNRSWAEVSSIPVRELNIMELQWLEGFNWCIHGPMYDENEGFFVWIDHWKDYEMKAKSLRTKEQHKLTPIDTTGYYRSQSTQPNVLLSPEGPIPPRYQQSSQFDWSGIAPYISEYSPPSAPHSGPATPDYYGDWSHGQAAPPTYSRNSWNPNSVTSAYNIQRSQPPSYHHTPAHQNYAQYHGSSCGCTLCAKQSEYYFQQHAHNMQTVVG